MNVPLLHPVTRWECPNCPKTAVTTEPRPHSEFHNCPGLQGLWVPMVTEGTRCKVVAVERGDYVGGNDVQYAPATGRPVVSVLTVRDDGYDNTVYADCARADMRGWD